MAKNKTITTLTLNPSLDLTLRVPNLVFDDSNRVESVRKDPGGKGINVSRVLHELGDPVTTLTFLGGDAGRQFRKLIRRQGMSLETVSTREETRENIIITETENNAQTRLHRKGSRITQKERQRMRRLIEKYAAETDVLAMGGSLPPGIPEDYYQKLILHLRENKVKCVLDADGEPYRLGVAAEPFLIKPNHFELSRLVGRKIEDKRGMKAAIRQLHEQGISIIIVSLGKEGAVVSDGKKMYQASPPHVAPGSTVGSGDSLVAGFLFKWRRAESLRESIRYGVAAGTATALTPGTELLRAEDVPTLYKKVKVSTY
jgi:1-phosphofructokinase family hexose kinase